ncbi:DNA helicase [Microbacterium sp. CJ88]|uniref:DNA helicase n=1 Tax=Microbacterium sp. CJ88 TaxID=3445672 RepID=UPI003F656613
MSLSRKRKKELRKLQSQANDLWDSQQVLVGQAAHVAREAGRQLGNFNREQVVPTVQESYSKYAAPYVERGIDVSKHVITDKVVPAAGAMVGSALSVWDAANDTRARIAAGKGLTLPDAKTYAKKADKYGKAATKRFASQLSAFEPQKKGIGAGGVIAIILGVAAAAGVLYAAWQTLRADDELWVADDPLRAPDA